MPIYLDTTGRTKIAIAKCDRCQVKYPYDELSSDPNYPGLRVCPDGCKDELDPYRLPPRETENITLEFPRPDVNVSSPGPSPNLVADPLPGGITEVGYVSTWQPSTPYAKGASITPQGINDAAVDLPQYWFVALNAGTSGASPPAWATNAGVIVTDGDIAWLCFWGIYPT